MMFFKKVLALLFLEFFVFNVGLIAQDILEVDLSVDGDLTPGRFYSRRKAYVVEVWVVLVKGDTVQVPDFDPLKWKSVGALTYRNGSPGYLGFLSSMLPAVSEKDFYQDPVLIYCSGEWEEYNCFPGWYRFEYPEKFDLQLNPGSYLMELFFSAWQMKKDFLGGRSLVNQIYFQREEIRLSSAEATRYQIEVKFVGYGLKSENYSPEIKLSSIPVIRK